MHQHLPELLQLYGRQAFAIDTGDGVGWANTFTDEGVFASPTYEEPVVGRDALTEFATKASQGSAAGRHIMTGTHVVEAISPDELQVRSLLLIVAAQPDSEPKILRMTVADDRVVRTDGDLCVARRDITRL